MGAILHPVDPGMMSLDLFPIEQILHDPEM